MNVTEHVKQKALQSQAEIVKASQSAEITSRKRVTALRQQVEKIKEQAGNSPNEAQARNIEYLGTIADEIEALLTAKRNELDMYARRLQATKNALDADKGAIVAQIAMKALQLVNEEFKTLGA